MCCAKLCHKQVNCTHRTAINFIYNIKDLLLAFSFPLVLIDVTGREDGNMVRWRMSKNLIEAGQITMYVSLSGNVDF